MKYLLSIFFIGITLYACSKKNEEVTIRNIVLHLVDSLSISDKSKPNLVFISDNYPKSRHHKFYDTLKKNTTDEELQKLTQDKRQTLDVMLLKV